MRSKTSRSRNRDRLTAAIAATGAMTLLAGVLVMGMAGTAQANEENEQVCTGLDSGKIDVSDPPSVLVTAPEGKLISGYCVKAGSIHNGFGPVYVTLEEPVKTYTITYPGKDSISHYSVSYVDIHDECPDLEGDQPEGTDCDRPDDEVEPLEQTRSSCEAGVEKRTGTRTTTYSFDNESNTWVPTTGPEMWEDWEKVRDLTAQERLALECDEVTAVNPGVDVSEECDVEGTYTIPDTQGVRYLLDGEDIEPGTYDGPVSGTLTAEASGELPLSNPGFSFELDVPAADVCEVLGEETERPTPKPDDEPTVKGVAAEVPTAVDAGFAGPVTGTPAAGSLWGQGLVTGGLLLLLLAGWMRWGGLSRGAHQF